MIRWKTVALLAREAGVAVLRDSLLQNPRIDLRCVAAHRKRPRVEDPARGERAEWASFEALCGGRGVPLVAADTRLDAGDLGFMDGGRFGAIDLICSVSWRFILSPAALARPRLGCVNLHRGELPSFAGAEPVRRMIEAGCAEAVISAHLMNEKVDAGPVLGTVRLPMRLSNTRGGGSADTSSQVEQVKAQLLSLYAPLMDLSIAAVAARQVTEDTGSG